MVYSNDLMIRLRAGDPEADDRRAARVEHLEEFVWSGDYRIPTLEIAAALLQDAALGRADFARFLRPGVEG